MQCCTYSKRIHTRRSPFSYSDFRFFLCSLLWSCPHCWISVSHRRLQSLNILSSSPGLSSTYTSSVYYNLPNHPGSNASLIPYSRLQAFYPPHALLLIPPSRSYPPSSGFGSSSTLPDFSSDSLRIVKLNPENFCVEKIEFLLFALLSLVNIICTELSILSRGLFHQLFFIFLDPRILYFAI